MSNTKLLLASLAILWVLCPSVQAEMDGTSTSSLKQQIQKAIDMQDLALTARERDGVLNTVTSFCVSSPYVYSGDDLAGLTDGVSYFLAHREEWERSRDDAPLRELVHRKDLIVLESGLATYEILRGTYGGKVAGVADKGYLPIVSEVINKHFGDISAEVRGDFLAEFAKECEAKSASLLTFAGKEPLSQEGVAEVRTALDASAEALATEMKEHLRQVPEDVRPSIVRDYLERLRPTLTRHFHLSTRALVTEIDAPEGEVREWLIRRKQERLARLRSVEGQLSDAYRIRGAASQARHAAEIRKDLVDQLLIAVGVQSLEAYESERVESIEGTIWGGPAVAAEATVAAQPLDDPMPAPGRQVRSNDTASGFRSGRWWLLLGVIALAVGCVLCVKKWPRYLWRRIACVAVSATVACSLQYSASVVCPAAEHPGQDVIVLQTKVSNELGMIWQELSQKRTERTTDMPEPAKSAFVRIKDVATRQLTVLDQSQLSTGYKRVALLMIRDLVDYSMCLPLDDAADARAADDIIEFYLQLHGDICSRYIDAAMWGKSVRRVVQSLLAEDFGPVHLATWSPQLKAELGRWWRGYCLLRMAGVERGVAYGRRISPAPWIHDDELLSDSYVRQLSRCHRILTQRLVMSETTRSMVKGQEDY